MVVATWESSCWAMFKPKAYALRLATAKVVLNIFTKTLSLIEFFLKILKILAPFIGPNSTAKILN